jgi:hypothetical protein
MAAAAPPMAVAHVTKAVELRIKKRRNDGSSSGEDTRQSGTITVIAIVQSRRSP